MYTKLCVFGISFVLTKQIYNSDIQQTVGVGKTQTRGRGCLFFAIYLEIDFSGSKKYLLVSKENSLQKNCETAHVTSLASFGWIISCENGHVVNHDAVSAFSF